MRRLGRHVALNAGSLRQYTTTTAGGVAGQFTMEAVQEHRAQIDKIGKELGLKRLSDWYSVSPKEIEEQGGGNLLKEYPSLSELLRAAYPDFAWTNTLFTNPRSTQGYWANLDNQRAFVAELGSLLGINQLSDWYNVSRAEFSERGGKVLFNYYGSLEDILRTLYPDFTWQTTRFADTNRVPRGYWSEAGNQRSFLDDLAKRLNISHFSEWYQVSRLDIDKYGGRGLWRYYASIEQVLLANYPEHPWDASKFIGAGRKNVPIGYWKDKENIYKALDTAEKAIGIRKPEDWYSVQLTELRELGFPARISRVELADLLRDRYPDYKWDAVYLLRGRFAQQKRLERAVASLFPDVELIVNARKEGGLQNPITKDFLELDVWIPSLNLAFEYQELHHYTSTEFAYNPLTDIQGRDSLKVDLAKAKGITLLVIPCWWDGRIESLAATIKQARPDLLTIYDAKGEPVSPNIPEGFLQKNTMNVEGIGNPVTACFMTSSNIDPTNWWLFEKYDGLRGFWNPEKKVIYSRKGNKLPLPDDVIKSMPSDMFLDGELWFGRDKFQEAMKIANRVNSAEINWSDFKFMVFDIPNLVAPYQERYNQLEKRFQEQPSKYIEVAPKQVCKDMDHFETLFQDILDKGGEGVILRDPRAEFTTGRSPGYLKHKKFRDAEAKVLGPAGYHQWECELPNGVKFTASPGTKEFVERYKPKPGDIVSFKHHGFLLGTGKPKLALIYRLRHDLTWEDVMKNWKEQKPTFTAYPTRRHKKKFKPKGYWGEQENRRKFFTDFAKEIGFDPLNADNWTKITAEHIRRRNGAGLLSHFDGVLLPALKSAFPELTFSGIPSKKPKGYWLDQDNRKEFFVSFAEENGFDPYVAENWENVPKGHLIKRGAVKLLAQYDGSLQAALEATFPDMKFSQNLTDKKHRAQWKANYFAKLFYYNQAGPVGSVTTDSTPTQN